MASLPPLVIELSLRLSTLPVAILTPRSRCLASEGYALYANDAMLGTRDAGLPAGNVHVVAIERKKATHRSLLNTSTFREVSRSLEYSYFATSFVLTT